MPAPTYSWNTITSAQTDADSPIDQTLMDSIRENLIHLEEWLGDGYTAAKNHNHDGVNSAGATVADGAITQLKLANYAAGDKVLAESLAEVSETGGTPVKKKEVVGVRSGTLRITFDLKAAAGGGARAKVYRNGAAVGSLKSTDSLTYVPQTEDISGWSPGDLIQLYVWTIGTGSYAQNFRVKSSFYTQEKVLL